MKVEEEGFSALKGTTLLDSPPSVPHAFSASGEGFSSSTSIAVTALPVGALRLLRPLSAGGAPILDADKIDTALAIVLVEFRL